MKPILFLDVDGVLNASGKTKQRFQGCLGLCPSMVERLRRILRETGCHVVLSSTWRKYPDHVKHLAKTIGRLWGERCIGETPILDEKSGAWLWSAKTRGDEIAAWLRENYIDRFVILDDDRDMGGLLPHLVETDTFVGLTDEIADEVIKRLK